jgi:hypothetical protein
MESADSQEGSVTSIDLLDECHQSIYQLRKKCKEMKKRSRLFDPTSSAEQKRDIPVNVSFQEKNGSHHEESPTLSRINPNSISRSESMESNPGNENPSTAARFSQPKKSISTNSPPKRSEGLTGFSSLEDQKNDKTAADIYEAFKKELRHWWHANPTKRTDEDIRGDLADDLTERFLCQRLDPLPASRVVTNIRKTMSHVIEEFASHGTLPAEIVTPEEERKALEPVTKFAKEKQELELKAIAEERERRERQQKESQESQVRRAEQEKQRIKEQYESYMKLKNQTKNVEKTEGKQEQELENHLDDIRSLISSIKGTAGAGR